MEITLLTVRTVAQIKKTTKTMGETNNKKNMVELTDLEFLVLNKAQSIDTSGWNSMTTTL